MALSNENIWSWGDINLDGIEDVMITFFPRQCDGGNASMNFQCAVLIISKNINDYYLIEMYPSANLGMGGHFYHFHAIYNGRIFATYVEYEENDSRCCPSIERDCVLDFKHDQLFLNGEKVHFYAK